MAGKGCQALTVEVVVGIVLRDQSLADQLINQQIAVFCPSVEQLVEVF